MSKDGDKSLDKHRRGPVMWAMGQPGVPGPMMRRMDQSEVRQTGEGLLSKISLPGSRTILAIAASIALTAGAVYGRTVGFNNSPRVKPPITLKDRNANTNLTCLRDTADDIFGPSLARNRWVGENCPPSLLRDIASAPDPLQAIVQARDALFAAVGAPAGLEQWQQFSQGGSAAPESAFTVDKQKLAKAQAAGAIASVDPDAIIIEK